MSPLIYDDWGERKEWFDLDSLLLDPSDKIEESRFFLSYMEKETEWNKFRWLTTAFVNSAYSFFDQAALRAHYRFSDPETGEPLPSEEALERLNKYAFAFPPQSKGRVHRRGEH